eukprot:s1958_g11.t1
MATGGSQQGYVHPNFAATYLRSPLDCEFYSSATMLRVCWMMFGAPLLAAAFRTDIVSSDTNSSGDELCCCYKKKLAYRTLAAAENNFILITSAHSQHRLQFLVLVFEILRIQFMFGRLNVGLQLLI